MKFAFITGIPTSGKTFLADKIAKRTNSIHVNIDNLRLEMIKKSKLKPFVNFFRNKDEKTYWNTISPNKHWNNIVNQSEAFWPILIAKIQEIQNNEQSAIFESVNILPHLAYQDLDFSGIVLTGESEEIVYSRLRENPRWGITKSLQKKEAKWFYNIEGGKYQAEANKYGFKVFKNCQLAKQELIRILKKQEEY